MRDPRLLPFGLLVAAAVAQLPLVYTLIARQELLPALALSMGALAMGLAWSAGCSLEDRRRGTVKLLALAGALLPLAAFLPFVPIDFAAWERGLLLLSSASCALGLALLVRRWGVASRGRA